MPTELLERILHHSKFPDAISLLLALGPKFEVQSNGLEAFLPTIIKHLPIDGGLVLGERTYEEVYGIIRLALKYHSNKSDFDEADRGAAYLLCKSIYQEGSIGKVLFGNASISLYLNMDPKE